MGTASPEDANGNFWNVGTIVEVGTREVAPGVTKGYLKVLDGEKNMLDALANNEILGATVYTFHDKATYGSALQHTFGEWSHTPVNSGGTTGTTEFRDSAGDIKTFMKGWLLVPTAQELGYLEITNVDTSLDKVVVKGDADTLSGIGQRYWLVAPAGVNPETGAIETDPCKMGSLWLWAGYHYRAPIIGFHNPPGQSAGTYGAQTGLNKVGSYHCQNRQYDPWTGRWTTPDHRDVTSSNLLDVKTTGECCCCPTDASFSKEDAPKAIGSKWAWTFTITARLEYRGAPGKCNNDCSLEWSERWWSFSSETKTYKPLKWRNLFNREEFKTYRSRPGEHEEQWKPWLSRNPTCYSLVDVPITDTPSMPGLIGKANPPKHIINFEVTFTGSCKSCITKSVTLKFSLILEIKDGKGSVDGTELELESKSRITGQGEVLEY